MLEENVKNIAKSDSNFAPIFAVNYVLPDMRLYRHSLINNTHIPKKLIYINNIYTYIYIYIYIYISMYIYFVNTKSMVKKLKRRFYIK